MMVAVASRLEGLDSKKNASPQGCTSGSLQMGLKSWGGHPSLLRLGTPLGWGRDTPPVLCSPFPGHNHPAPNSIVGPSHSDRVGPAVTIPRVTPEIATAGPTLAFRTLIPESQLLLVEVT